MPHYRQHYQPAVLSLEMILLGMLASPSAEMCGVQTADRDSAAAEYCIGLRRPIQL